MGADGAGARAGCAPSCPRSLLSADTRKAEVARRALVEGADLINDVGGLRDPAMVGWWRRPAAQW